MTINYTKSWIMKCGHRIARYVREECKSYRDALSRGLKKAWAIVKGVVSEEVKDLHEVVYNIVGVSECGYEVVEGLSTQVSA